MCDLTLNLIHATRLGARITENNVIITPSHPLAVDSPLAVSTAAVSQVVLDEIRKKYNNPQFKLKAHNRVTDPYNPGLSFTDKNNSVSRFSYAIDHSVCWQRFFAIKELMHIYTGLSNAGTGTDIIAAALKSMENFRRDIHEKLDPESFCVFLALEVMWPRQERDNLYNLRHKKRMVDFPIAVTCKTPLFFTQELFAKPGEDYKGYFAVSGEAYRASL